MEETNTLLQAVDTIGTLGLLGGLVWMFMTGKIISKPVHDEMIDREKDEKTFLREEIVNKLERINERE